MDKKAIFAGLLIALFLAIIFSPFASPWPDGLEKVAEDKGFLEKGEGVPVMASPVPDYSWPGIKSEFLATSAAGAFGTALVFFLGWGVAFAVSRKS